MENLNLYQDIAKRTDGDIYVGVVGPVRTGKSTFIKNFMNFFIKVDFPVRTGPTTPTYISPSVLLAIS